MTNRVFAHVDINNCYVSCQRVYDLSLNDRPVVVMSNNDGCAIARSAEAKALGIKMGAPRRDWEHLIVPHNIAVLSSRYDLYAEYSQRFMEILSMFVAPVDIYQYSIDEVFLELTNYRQIADFTAYAFEMKNRLWQWCRLPVCVGIGYSITQAKLANFLAKKNPCFKGVCNFDALDLSSIETMLMNIPVGEVWGVGAKIEKRLNDINIMTVMDLVMAEPKRIGKLFNSMLERTVLELNAIPCFEFDDTPADKQQIVCSRSFGNAVTSIDDVKEALTHFTTMAVKKLRSQGSCCKFIAVSISSDRFKKNGFVNFYRTIQLPDHIDDLLTINESVMFVVDHIYRPGHKYKRAGVMIFDIKPKSRCVPDLFADHSRREQKEALNVTFENIRKLFGRESLMLGLSGLPDRAWSMRQSAKTQNYFSSFNELMVIN